MPEHPVRASAPQVTRGGAGHPDNGWAGPADGCGLNDPESASAAAPEAAAIAALTDWFARERMQLRVAAETLEIAVMERLRAQRRQHGVGPRGARLGLRIRDPRRPGGSFTIEWFRVQRRGRTDYIPRGRGDSYPRSAFAGALSWERGIAVAAEQTLGAIRRRLRLMKEIERSVAGFQALLGQPLEASGPDNRRAPGAGAERG
jgi:hypothetical protein